MLHNRAELIRRLTQWTTGKGQTNATFCNKPAVTTMARNKLDVLRSSRLL